MITHKILSNDINLILKSFSINLFFKLSTKLCMLLHSRHSAVILFNLCVVFINIFKMWTIEQTFYSYKTNITN